MTDKEGISIREFSRREGVSDTLIHMAIKSGKLTQLANGKMDPGLVGSQWRMGRMGRPRKTEVKPPLQSAAEPLQSAAPAPEPPPGPQKGLPYGEALRVKENYLAFLRRLDYEQRSGSVVDMEKARSVVFELCREQRDIWLAWPARVAPLIAAELGIADLDFLLAALTLYVQRQLAELGEPDVRFEAV